MKKILLKSQDLNTCKEMLEKISRHLSTVYIGDIAVKPIEQGFGMFIQTNSLGTWEWPTVPSVKILQADSRSLIWLSCSDAFYNTNKRIVNKHVNNLI